MLIWPGGWLVGVMAAEPVNVPGSQAFSERIVAWKVCRFVCGTTSNVQVTGPSTGAGGCGPVGSG